MRQVDIASAKLSVVFPARKLAAIDPADPTFVLVLDGMEIQGKVKSSGGEKTSIELFLTRLTSGRRYSCSQS
jgi:hypothetical protein